MEPSPIGGNGEADRQFLEEGVRSYLKAATAMVAFERQIQEKCRSVLEGNIGDYTDALKVSNRLDGKEIEDWLDPATAKFDGSWRMVGVAIQGKRFDPYVRWWGSYCVLNWEGEKCYAEIAEWIGGPRTQSEKLFQCFRKLEIKIYDKEEEAGLYQVDKWVGLCQLIKPEEAKEFEEPLERLMQQWIGLWKKTGGMKGVFK